jgi:tungstate transport system ATP-binding protein
MPVSAIAIVITIGFVSAIRTLAAEGMTIVMTNHDLGQARRLSQRVLFLNRGRLVEDAETAAFFATPSTQEARAFIAGDLLW